MKITDIFMLAGGLALFLYGMQIMGEGLELAAGSRLKSILERLTSNRLLAVLVGLVTTAIIQSSSATTVMVVGFVNAGLMNLTQAIGVIMGANIGTTITGQLIALNISAVAPVIAFVGMILIMFSKKKQTKYIGQVVIGLGILFIGMNTMSTAMVPLREVKEFQLLMTKFSNPVVGILAGMLITCIIQSSSASIGILQALASQGLIGIGGAMYVIFGQNIGTCITSVLAAIGSNKNAKRTAASHVLFNVAGTVIFLFIAGLLPFEEWMMALAPNNTVLQIANVHTIFNIVTTIIMFPFCNYLAKMAIAIIPGEEEGKKELRLDYINQGNFLDSSIAISNIESEVTRMSQLASTNLSNAIALFKNNTSDHLDQIQTNEDALDYLNMEILKYAVKVNRMAMDKSNASQLNKHVIVTRNLERIGDYCQNLVEHMVKMKENKVELSKVAKEELNEMSQLLETMFEKAWNPIVDKHIQYREVAALEDGVDDKTDQYRLSHLERMKNGECTCESGILYDEILTDLERIGDHLYNIAQERYTR